jgi:FMN-binding domain
MQARLILMPLTYLVAAAPVQAAVYLSIEQAQTLMFPGATLTPDFRHLSADQLRAVEQDSGVRSSADELQLWRAAEGGWFIVDQVIGKHSPIRYAVALDAQGAVRQIEILEYSESYGGEVRLPAWRRQFVGKRRADQLEIDQNIRNISGATLSCSHVTQGVRRLLSIHALLLSANANG